MLPAADTAAARVMIVPHSADVILPICLFPCLAITLSGRCMVVMPVSSPVRQTGYQKMVNIYLKLVARLKLVASGFLVLSVLWYLMKQETSQLVLANSLSMMLASIAEAYMHTDRTAYEPPLETGQSKYH